MEERNKSSNTTSTCSGSKEKSNNNNNNNTKGKDNNQVEGEFNGIGHGELYSPAYALRPLVNNTISNNSTTTNSMGVLAAVKERLLEKLAAAAVPAEALDKARRLLETVVRDATLAAHALSKDALHRIKSHLIDILPSLSPALTTKMVDEAEKEAAADEANKNKEEESSSITTSTSDYQESNYKPSSRL